MIEYLNMKPLNIGNMYGINDGIVKKLLELPK